MHELRWPAKLYGSGVILAAVSLGVGTALAAPRAADHGVLLALAFTALLVGAKRFPLHVAPKTKVTLDTVVLFAAVLLFDPVVAMALAAAGTLLAQWLGRQGGFQTLFNSAQAVLRVGVSALLLVLVEWDVARVSFAHPEQLLILAGAAGVMYVLDALIVQMMVAAQTGLTPRLVWRQALRLGGAEELAQLALGVLAAAVIDVYPWALPLFLLPALAIYHALERHVQLRQQTVEALDALAAIVDLRDCYTAAHSQRVAAVARELAIALRLVPAEVELVERAARVHDVGKVIVNPAILAKEAQLTDAEWVELKRHPITGAEILSRFPQFARATSYVRHHHEWINGRGYPDGLRGEAIPLGARILAVADAFDSMASARPYRPALPSDRVVAEFARRRGQQWDDRVVAALFGLLDEGRIGRTQEFIVRTDVTVTVGAAQPVRASRITR